MLDLDLTRGIVVPISAQDIERNKGKKIVGWAQEDLEIAVTIADSLSLNCVLGTHVWIARHFGRRRTAATVREVLEAALRSGDSYEQAEKACRFAVQKHKSAATIDPSLDSVGAVR
jgi:hypothetical protein